MAAARAIRIGCVGGMVLLDERRQRLFAFNRTADAIWRLSDEGRTLDEIASLLAEAHGIAPHTAKADVARIVAQWRAAGLIGADPPPPVPNVPIPAPPDADAPVRTTDYVIDGRALRIAGADRAVMDHIEATLARFRGTAPGPRTMLTLHRTTGAAPYLLRVDGADTMRLAGAAEAVGALFQTLLGIVHAGTDWLALIHGAAVATPAGRAILLPGAGGSGKSTLAAWLSRRGFRFLSDDMIALRAPDGAALPWPLPHSIKQGVWPTLTPVMPEIAAAPIASVHGRAIKFIAPQRPDWRTAAPAGAIVFPRYDPAGDDRLHRLEPIEALGRLLGDRIWLGHPLGKARIAAFLEWLERVPAYAAHYGTLAQAEALVRSIDA